MTVDNITDGIKEYVGSEVGVNNIVLTEGLTTITIVANMIIKLLVGLIIVGLPIVIAIEVIYINMPIFEAKFENIYNRLEGKSQRAFGLLIRDARKSIEESRTTKYGQSTNTIYLKRKAKAVFVCAFLVAMVLGPGQVLIKYAMAFISKFIDAISLSMN